MLNDNVVICSAELKSEQEKAMEKLLELQRLNETYTEKTSEGFHIIIIIIIIMIINIVTTTTTSVIIATIAIPSDS